jgi:hypothetical protein
MKFRLARRFIGAGAALAMALGMGGGALPALAATTLTVHCKGGDHTTIQDAVNAASAGSTVKVCAGTYQEYVSITGKNNLKLIASGKVLVQPPIVPYTRNGPIIGVTDSLNVTVQGFVVMSDNLFDTNSTDYSGITFTHSSGTITKNSVINIRRYPADSSAGGTGIEIINAMPGVLPVKINSNTVAGFQNRGIDVQGNVKASITRNVLTASTVAGNVLIGIAITGGAPGGAITGNTLTFDGIPPYTANVKGIQLENTSKNKVSGNKISGVNYGINLTANCGEITNSNTISGNIIRIADYAIQVATNTMTTCAAEVKFNQVTSNTLVDTMLQGVDGILVGHCCWADADGNVLKGNKIYGFLSNPIDYMGTATTLIGNKTDLLPPPGF